MLSETTSLRTYFNEDNIGLFRASKMCFDQVPSLSLIS